MTKLTPAQVTELATEAAKEMSKGHLRMGQALMNALYRVNPSSYGEVVAANNKIDPFYVDAHIPEFWKFVS